MTDVFTDDEMDLSTVVEPTPATAPVAAPVVQEIDDDEMDIVSEADVTPPEETRIMGFTNQGIAEGFGGLVDLAAAGINLALPEDMAITDPFLGGKSIARGFRALGINMPALREDGTIVEPSGLGEEIQRVVGQTASMLNPLGEIANLASRGTGVGARIAGDILEQARGKAGIEAGKRFAAATAPASALALELASATAAGAGGFAASKIWPDSPTAKVWGQLIGGFGTAPLMTLRKATPMGVAIRVAAKTITPFMKRGATIRAQERLKGLTPDPEEAARRMDEDFIADLSPATRTGERKLMALEEQIIKTDPELEENFTVAAQEARETLERAMKQIAAEGDVGDTVAFVESQRARLLNAYDVAVRQAFANAQKRVSGLGTDERVSETSRIVSEEIDHVLQGISKTETEAWNAVNMTLTSEVTNASLMYRAMMGQLDRSALAGVPKEEADAIMAMRLPKALRDKMPADAKRFLDAESNEALREGDNVLEVWGLRSNLLEVARNARKEGQRNTERIANELADALLTDLGAQASAIAGPNSAALRHALDVTALKKSMFQEGAVGSLLRQTRGGNRVIPPSDTLPSTIGRGGIRGDEAVEEILAAAPNTAPEIKLYLRQLFQQRATTGSIDEGDLTIRPEAARRFVRENIDLMDRYPDIRNRIHEAADLQDDALALEAIAKETRRSLHDTKLNFAARFLGADVHEEIASVVSAKNPRSAARKLRITAKQDETGRASEGLTAGAIDYLMLKARQGAYTDDGTRLLSGRALRNALDQDKDIKAVMSELLTPEQATRVRRIAKELTLLERREGKLPNVGGIIEDVPSRLLSLFVTLGAARKGAQVGGKASLKMSQEFSSRAKELLTFITRDRAKEVLTEAATNGELYSIMLLSLKGQGAARTNARLNAWLAGPGRFFIDRLDEKYGKPPEEMRVAPGEQSLDEIMNDQRDASDIFGEDFTNPEDLELPPGFDGTGLEPAPTVRTPLNIEIRTPRGGADEGTADPFDQTSRPPDPDSGSVSPDLIDRIIQAESGGDPNAVSEDGAVGLMQIMPKTARNPGFGVEGIDPDSLKDPDVNRAFGTEYFNALLNAFEGDLVAASVAYNWGPRNARRWKNQGSRVENLPDETRGYIERIYGDRARPVPSQPAEKREFDPEGSGYDYESARKAGLGPDKTGHWPSREPKSGLILKGRAHPTYRKTQAGESRAGYEITKRGDRYYSAKRNPDVATADLDVAPQQGRLSNAGGTAQRRTFP